MKFRHWATKGAKYDKLVGISFKLNHKLDLPGFSANSIEKDIEYPFDFKAPPGEMIVGLHLNQGCFHTAICRKRAPLHDKLDVNTEYVLKYLHEHEEGFEDGQRRVNFNYHRTLATYGYPPPSIAKFLCGFDFKNVNTFKLFANSKNRFLRIATSQQGGGFVYL